MRYITRYCSETYRYGSSGVQEGDGDGVDGCTSDREHPEGALSARNIGEIDGQRNKKPHTNYYVNRPANEMIAYFQKDRSTLR